MWKFVLLCNPLSRYKIIIVGAGSAGLLPALMLSSQDIPVHVVDGTKGIDQRPRPPFMDLDLSQISDAQGFSTKSGSGAIHQPCSVGGASGTITKRGPHGLTKSCQMSTARIFELLVCH